MIKTIKQTGKKAITGLALIAALATSSLKAEEPKVSGFAKTTAASEYITQSGTQIGEGTALQGLVVGNVSYKDVNLSTYVWIDKGLETGNLDEIDYGISVAFPTPIKDVSLSVDYKRWTFPDHDWDSNDILGTVISYKGSVDVSLQLEHLFKAKNTESGNRAHISVSKPIVLYEVDDLSVKLNPTITAAYEDNFFGRDGLAHITPGITIKLTKGDYSLEGTINFQINKGNEIDNPLYGSIGVGVNF